MANEGFFIVILGSPNKIIMILVVTGIVGRGTTQVITLPETNIAPENG